VLKSSPNYSTHRSVSVRFNGRRSIRPEAYEQASWNVALRSLCRGKARASGCGLTVRQCRPNLAGECYRQNFQDNAARRGTLSSQSARVASLEDTKHPDWNSWGLPRHRRRPHTGCAAHCDLIKLTGTNDFGCGGRLRAKDGAIHLAILSSTLLLTL